MTWQMRIGCLKFRSDSNEFSNNHTNGGLRATKQIYLIGHARPKTMIPTNGGAAPLWNQIFWWKRYVSGAQTLRNGEVAHAALVVVCRAACGVQQRRRGWRTYLCLFSLDSHCSQPIQASLLPTVPYLHSLATANVGTSIPKERRGILWADLQPPTPKCRWFVHAQLLPVWAVLLLFQQMPRAVHFHFSWTHWWMFVLARCATGRSVLFWAVDLQVNKTITFEAAISYPLYKRIRKKRKSTQTRNSRKGETDAKWHRHMRQQQIIWRFCQVHFQSQHNWRIWEQIGSKI